MAEMRVRVELWVRPVPPMGSPKVMPSQVQVMADQMVSTKELPWVLPKEMKSDWMMEVPWV